MFSINLYPPKENAYFCPEELVSTLMDMSIRVGRSFGQGVLPSHFKTIDQ